MVKKQVPDWLNSSLWSSNPPPPPPPPRHPSPPPSSSVATTDRKLVVPVAPKPATKPPEPVKVEIRDPLRDGITSTSTDHDYNGTPSPSSSTLEDVSKQALLLQEVYYYIFSMCIRCLSCLILSKCLLKLVNAYSCVKSGVKLAIKCLQ